MFTLSQLRAFVAVAEELHFGRAAERLRMTQPPLSRQIQNLEREVGVKLLDRDKRTVKVTPAGSAFLLQAHRLLTLAEAAPERARRIQAGSVGSVSVGFTAGSSFGTLPRLLDRIGAELPGVDIELAEMVTAEQIVALRSGEIDLGLARPQLADDCESRLIHREEMVAAVPAGHWTTRLDRPVAVDDLVHERLIMHSATRARYFHDLVIRMMPCAHQNVAHTVSQILTMIWLVAGGHGVALVPASAAGLHIAGVTHLPLRDAAAYPVELHLLWRRSSDNPALAPVLTALEDLGHE